MPDPLSIFISYSHKDGKELALRLRTDLARLGFSPWLDQQRLQGGATWSREIEDALDNSTIVLALLSAGSFASEVCRGEQLRSLRRGVCVIPLLVQTGADRPVYLESKQYLDFSLVSKYKKRLKELADNIVLRSGAQLVPRSRETRYDTVPPMPTNFVARPEEFRRLREAIVSDRNTRNIALMAVKGMGGVGKTVLAQAVCRDETVQAAFPQGVIWVTIGQNPSDAHLVGQMAEVAKALGESPEGFGTLEGSARLLRSMLEDKPALLVIDDVWDARHVYCFQPNDDKALYRILLTTRKAEIVSSLGADSVSIGELSRKQSSELLARYAALPTQSLPPSASEIARECRGLPLALAMIGAMLRQEPAQRWNDVLDSLQNADLQDIGIQFPHYAYSSLIAAIEVGIKDLPSPIQDQYLDLAVFKEDIAIPEGALSILWQQTGKATRRVVSDLVNRSLATRDDSGRILLHDLQLDYVRGRRADSRSLHQRLIDGYRRQCTGGWHTGSDDGYFFQHIVYHLKSAGEDEELFHLLLNFDWIRTKLERVDVAALVDDFDYVLCSGAHPSIDTTTDIIGQKHVGLRRPPQSISGKPIEQVVAALRLLQSSLRAAAPVLSANKYELRGELFRRLAGKDNQLIQCFVEEVRCSDGIPFLHSLLTHPILIWGNTESRTRQSDSINTIAITTDGRLAVVGSDEHAFQILELSSGRVMNKFGDSGYPINIVALSQDEQHVLSASVDNMVEEWNLLTGKKVRSIIADDFGAYVAGFSSDGSTAISASTFHFLRLWGVRNCQTMVTLAGHDAWILSCALSTNGRYAASGSEDGIVIVWDLRRGEALARIAAHSNPVTAVAITTEGTLVVSGSADGSMSVWRSDGKAQPITRFTSSLNALSITQDERYAVSALSEGKIAITDFASGASTSCEAAETELLSLAITPNQRTVLTGLRNGSLYALALEAGQRSRY